MFKFTNDGERITRVFHPPQSVYEADSLQLMKVRFDKLESENYVYYLLIEDTAYKLHLQEESACLKTRKDANEAHVALIKAWVATFRGQEINLMLVVHTE